MSQEDIVARTDELTDTMQVIANAFPNLKGRPSSMWGGLVSVADLQR